MSCQGRNRVDQTRGTIIKVIHSKNANVAGCSCETVALACDSRGTYSPAEYEQVLSIFLY